MVHVRRTAAELVNLLNFLGSLSDLPLISTLGAAVSLALNEVLAILQELRCAQLTIRRMNTNVNRLTYPSEIGIKLSMYTNRLFCSFGSGQCG